MVDYYNLLQVPPEAPAEAIRAAYRREAKRFHPDAHPHAARAEREALERRFILLAQAYDALSDPVRRRAYDNQWRARFGATARSAPRTAEPRQERRGDRGTRPTAGQAQRGEPAPDWDELLRDVESLLGRFGLDLRQPLERLLETLLDWARALFREVAGVWNPQPSASGTRRSQGPASAYAPGERGRERASGRGPARPRRPVEPDPEHIERELAELKRRARQKE
jgi:curved DNA-binding protein CbpA